MAKPKFLIWNKRQMKLSRVDDGGDRKHPKAYLILRAELTAEEFRARNLDGINHAGIDREQSIPLDVGILGYGGGFEVQLILGVADPEQETMFEPGTVLAKVEAEKISSASIKEQTLQHNILVPLKNWEEFGRIRDYVGQELKVTVWQGTVAGEGQGKIG